MALREDKVDFHEVQSELVGYDQERSKPRLTEEKAMSSRI